MANIGKGRALRVCDACGLVDDHPRHTMAGGSPDIFERPLPLIVRKVSNAVHNLPDEDAERLMAELLDGGSTDLHLDCCRARGCPTGECDTRTAGAETKRGAALVKHLEALTKGQDS